MSISTDQIIESVKRIPEFAESEICVERLFSGTNIVSLVKSNISAVVFREFRAAKLIDPNRERAVFSLASELNIGPKALIVEEKFRIEEFIPGRTMERTECSQYLESTALALSNFHSIPFHSTQNSILSYLENWKTECELNLSTLPSDSQILSLINSEWSTVLSLLVYNSEEFVLCHNDFSYGNLIITSTGVKVIDYDYSGFGHPSVDLATFCIETMFDFSQPVYQFLPQEELTKDQQQVFVQHYSRFSKRDFEDMWKKFLRSKATVCFLGALWAGCQYSEANTSMLDYMRIRLSLYNKYKNELIFL